jgi:hypothetical protein
LNDKKSVLDKKNITVYFGSFYVNGYIDFDLDDRIIVSDKNGDSTVIFRSAISAITVHNSDKSEEDVSNHETEDKPFIIALKFPSEPPETFTTLFEIVGLADVE